MAALLLCAGSMFAQSSTPADPCACCDPCCECCDPCCACSPCDSSRTWVRAEYLLWRFKNSPLPTPLVTTTSNPNGAEPGALGGLGTQVLIGSRDVDSGAHHGARFTAGIWLDGDHTLGIDGGYFFLASKTVSQGVVSNGGPNSPVLAVPFFDADTMTERVFLRAIPNVASGSALLSLTSRLQGAELNGVWNLRDWHGVHLEALGGFRFVDLVERLSFATAATGLEPALPPAGNQGLVFDTLDQFNTRNDFYGGQLGIRGEWQRGKWSVSGSLKVALGDMFEQVNRQGDYLTNVLNNPAGGSPVSHRGFGTFVQHSNQGGDHRHEFAVVPEVGLNLGYQVTSSLRLLLGYDFLYLSDVLRPGKQIDRTINFSQTFDSIVAGRPFTPGSRPAATVSSSDFWAQGVNFGVELRY
jgi:hypothetical protein